MTSPKGQSHVGHTEFDLDARIQDLETEWRQAYEASIAERSSYQALAAKRTANADLLDAALERMDRAEALKARIMTKIERLEERLLNRG